MELAILLDSNRTSENVTAFSAIDLNETLFTNITRNASAPRPMSQFYKILVGDLCLSIVCSILLIVVYKMIGENRTLPGKIVISISSCYIVTYTFLMIGFTVQNYIDRKICYGMGVIAHTFFVASFFWTNVMSYDIMRTIAAMRPSYERKRQFLKYSIYVWTGTFIFILPAIVVDMCDSIPRYYKPQFGVRKCWLNGSMGFFLFFNGPVGLTLFVNFVFFVVTARAIAQVQNTSAILAANRHKRRYYLSMKLVLIMGLVWVPEFIPFFLDVDWLFILAGILICLHGVYMFAIFVCNRRTIKQIVGLACPGQRLNSPTFRKTKQSPSVVTITTTMSSSSIRG